MCLGRRGKEFEFELFGFWTLVLSGLDYFDVFLETALVFDSSAGTKEVKFETLWP